MNNHVIKLGVLDKTFQCFKRDLLVRLYEKLMKAENPITNEKLEQYWRRVQIRYYEIDAMSTKEYEDKFDDSERINLMFGFDIEIAKSYSLGAISEIIKDYSKLSVDDFIKQLEIDLKICY